MVSSNKITQGFLDSSQYQVDTILEYEKIYGEDFVSPGGHNLAVELISRLDLNSGVRVLDVGCGLGGSAFVMAREFNLQVDGIDLSKNMLSIANHKLAVNGLSNKVNFFWGDCLELSGDTPYDVIYSRDVFLHIHDKKRLFTVLYNLLPSGGQLLFTDYCAAAKPWSDEFKDYVETRGYDLHTIDDYAELISAAGFEQVVCENATSRFAEILKTEKQRIKGLDIEPEKRSKLEQSWQQKYLRAQAGEQCWGIFTARKL
ncbi:MAG: phosphoethanolamine N-methyltransferase [Gammaproteobacteria bacterium]|jgi:phosphoethanolamine N-methyltransferase